MSRHLARVAAPLLALLVGACTDAVLVPPAEDEPPPFDDKLALSGRVCTSDPVQMVFPLKVLFIVDTSQSMGSSDPPDLAQSDLTQRTGRSRAIRNVITRFIDLSVQYAAAPCNTDPETGCAKGEICEQCRGDGVGDAICVGPDCCAYPQEPDSECMPRVGVECPPPGSFNGRCLPLCDTGKAGCGPGEVGCEDCPNPGDRCLNGICGTQRDPGVEFAIMRFGSAKQVLTRDINGEEGFTSDAAELVSTLPQVNNAGSVTDLTGALSYAYEVLSTDIKRSRDSGAAINRAKYVVILLTDGQLEQSVDNADEDDDSVANPLVARVADIVSLKALYGLGEITVHTAYVSGGAAPLARGQSIALLEQMAQVGGGTFRDFASGEQLSFMHVDFSSLRRVFMLKNLLVSNINGYPVSTKTIVDSDGDGLADTTEVLAGTGRDRTDSDVDGYSDQLEHFFRTSGWDPLDPSDADCRLEIYDVDGDGKPDDSDGDGLHDCEERFLGTHRYRFDTDADGIPDSIELKFGTNPVADDRLKDLDFDGMPNGAEIRLHTNPRVDDASYRSRMAYRYDVVRRGSGIEMVGRSCDADADCPGRSGCVAGACRCSDATHCSSGSSCGADADCTVAGETCREGRCRSDDRCVPLDDGVAQKGCAVARNITCYDFTVENITLVSPRGSADEREHGWNTVMLYFAEAPFDDPAGQGNYRVACVRARYDDESGAKLPVTGKLRVPQTAWRAPTAFDPASHCVVPE